MKIIEIRPRRKFVSGIVFDIEVDPKEFGADPDAAGWLSLDAELCEMKHLAVGTVLSDEELASLIEESHIKRAKSRAMWYISQSDHSKKGLIKKLSAAFPDYAANAAAERLEELGLVNDQAFAERRLQRILEEKKVSLRMAKQLLLAEGLDREIVDLVSESLEYNQDGALCELIERKYKDKLNSKKDVDKMMSALLRKGYSYSDIKDALNVLEIEFNFTEEL
jgi:regulatory protein